MSKLIVAILLLLADYFGLSSEVKKLITRENLESVQEVVTELLGEGEKVEGVGGVQAGAGEQVEETGEVAGEAVEVVGETLEQTYKVSRVIDGDTIELESGQKLRYIGIDTPETVHPTKEDGCFGKEASDFNKQLVEGKEVRLEKDVSETDRYGRLLRYVYLDDVFVNEYLVKEGYAVSSSYPPDVKYQEKFNEAERFARENNKGLWGGACELVK